MQFSKMPLFIVLITLKWPNKAPGLTYFLVFVHHSTFKLPSLQVNRTKQQTATFTFAHSNFENMYCGHGAVSLTGLVQGLQFNIQNVCDASCLCFWVSEHHRTAEFLLPSSSTLLGWWAAPFPPVHSTGHKLYVKSGQIEVTPVSHLSPWSDVLWKDTDVSRTPLRCCKVPFEMKSYWNAILHSSCTRISWMLPFICCCSNKQMGLHFFMKKKPTLYCIGHT